MNNHNNQGGYTPSTDGSVTDLKPFNPMRVAAQNGLPDAKYEEYLKWFIRDSEQMMHLIATNKWDSHQFAMLSIDLLKEQIEKAKGLLVSLAEKEELEAFWDDIPMAEVVYEQGNRGFNLFVFIVSLFSLLAVAYGYYEGRLALKELILFDGFFLTSTVIMTMIVWRDWTWSR